MTTTTTTTPARGLPIFTADGTGCPLVHVAPGRTISADGTADGRPALVVECVTHYIGNMSRVVMEINGRRFEAAADHRDAPRVYLLA